MSDRKNFHDVLELICHRSADQYAWCDFVEAAFSHGYQHACEDKGDDMCDEKTQDLAYQKAKLAYHNSWIHEENERLRASIIKQLNNKIASITPND